MSAGSSNGFCAQVGERTGIASVTVSGEIDLCSAGEFRDALTSAMADCHGRMVVDLRDTTFMDASGLSVLAGAYLGMGQSRDAIVILDSAPIVSRAFEITGMTEMFEMSSTGDAACADRSSDDRMAPMS